MAEGFTVELASLLDVANQCIPNITGSLGATLTALYTIENDENQVFDDPAAAHGHLFDPPDAATGGLYADLQGSFVTLREELVAVIRNLGTNMEKSQEALRRIHDRYAAADAP